MEGEPTVLRRLALIRREGTAIQPTEPFVEVVDAPSTRAGQRTPFQLSDPGRFGGGQRIVILLGEEGSGRRTLLGRISSLEACSPVAELECGPLRLLDLPEFRRVLRELSDRSVGGVVGPRALLIQDADTLQPDRTTELLGILRGYMDSPRKDDPVVFLAGEDDRILHDGAFSGLGSVSNIYRLAWLSGAEIADRVPEGRVDEILLWTGGQPQLVASWGQLVSDRVHRPGQYLRDHPPEVVERWKARLASLCMWSGQLRARARALVSGRDFAELPEEAMALYLAGWIYPDESGGGLVWRMPRCHRRWAQDVAIRPERYAGGAA